MHIFYIAMKTPVTETRDFTVYHNVAMFIKFSRNFSARFRVTLLGCSPPNCACTDNWYSIAMFVSSVLNKNVCRLYNLTVKRTFLAMTVCARINSFYNKYGPAAEQTYSRVYSRVRRLCSRLTALWRYINFVLLLLLLLLRYEKLDTSLYRLQTPKIAVIAASHHRHRHRWFLLRHLHKKRMGGQQLSTSKK